MQGRTTCHRSAKPLPSHKAQPRPNTVNPLWAKLATRVEHELVVNQHGDEFERAAGASGAAMEAPESSIGPAIGDAHPLPDAVREWAEPRFGADFSGVRISTGAPAAKAASEIAARAFTLGRNIVFARGEFAPDSAAGRNLVAHELTHTLQQRGARALGISNASPYIARQDKKKEAKKTAPKVKVGKLAGWDYIAYLEPGPKEIRLGWNVHFGDKKRDKRVGTIPWITHNPGNVTASTGEEKDVGRAAKEAFKLGAAETLFRNRYAIFATPVAGINAVHAMLKLFSETGKGGKSLQEALKAFKGVDPGEDPSVKARYVQQIRDFMAESISARDEIDLAEAGKKAEKILSTKFADFSQSDEDLWLAIGGLAKVEGAFEPPGVEYLCGSGFADNERVLYNDYQWGLIEKLKTTENEDKIKEILGC